MNHLLLHFRGDRQRYVLPGDVSAENLGFLGRAGRDFYIDVAAEIPEGAQPLPEGIAERALQNARARRAAWMRRQGEWDGDWGGPCGLAPVPGEAEGRAAADARDADTRAVAAELDGLRVGDVILTAQASGEDISFTAVLPDGTRLGLGGYYTVEQARRLPEQADSVVCAAIRTAFAVRARIYGAPLEDATRTACEALRVAYVPPPAPPEEEEE